jgi:hypothetical protein
MKEATSDLLIVDTYADDVLLRLVAGLNLAVRVRIITRRADPGVQTVCSAYQADGRVIEMPEAKTIHDRYVVIDHATVWSMGASFNQFGAKAHDVMQTVDQAAQSEQIAAFEEAWRKGKPL